MTLKTFEDQPLPFPLPRRTKKNSVLAFKAFGPDLTCRGFKYEVGKSYKIDGPIVPCEKGFHACEYILDVFEYYLFSLQTRVCVVELFGTIEAERDKLAASDIRILYEIPMYELDLIINKGDRNVGYGNIGDGNNGHFNKGHGNNGHFNKGYGNNGNNNNGNNNNGNNNNGNNNNGNDNQGDRNKGNYNVGHGHKGNYNNKQTILQIIKNLFNLR